MYTTRGQPYKQAILWVVVDDPVGHNLVDRKRRDERYFQREVGFWNTGTRSIEIAQWPVLRRFQIHLDQKTGFEIDCLAIAL